MATKITSRVLADDAIVRATLGDDAIGVAEIADDAVTTAAIADDVALGGNPTTTTQSTANSTTRIATTAFVQAAIDSDISALIDSAPGTLNTLNEIAAALNDDPSFTTTVNNAIALKAPALNPVFTGNATFDTNTLYVHGANNRVGVGTTNPLINLDIKSSGSNGNVGARIWNTGTQANDDAVLGFLTQGNRNYSIGIHRDSGSFIITNADASVASGELLSIQNAGNVGIGTASPDSILHIYEDDSSAGNTQLHIENDKTDDAAVLRIEGKRTSANDTGQILFANNNNLISAIKAYSAADDGDIRFYTSATSSGNTLSERFRIGTAGQLGVAGGNNGTDGQVLTSTGASSAPAWESLAASTIDALSDATTSETNSIMLGTATHGTISGAAQNTSVGIGAMDAITSAEYTVAIGYNAATALTSGSYNTAVGGNAFITNQNGHSNTMIGMSAGKLNLQGSSNVAVGRNALVTNVNSDRNTAIGTNALNLATTADNTAVGYDALKLVGTGHSNTAVGSFAGDAITTGLHNVAIGKYALSTNQTRNSNTAVGTEALTTTTGEQNTAVGYQALRLLQDAHGHTAVGFEAMMSATGGASNVGVGYRALKNNLTKNYNTAMGKGALEYFGRVNANSDGWNTAVGAEAMGGSNSDDISYSNAFGGRSLKAMTSSDYNNAFGYQAGTTLTTGGSNSFFGHKAGTNIRAGVENVSMGREALASGANSDASNNTAVGTESMKVNTTGTQNAAFGKAAMILNESGNYNCGIGPYALKMNTTNSHNTAVGWSAMLNATGSQNTAVGSSAMDNSSCNGSNNTAVGFEAMGKLTSGGDNTAVGRAALLDCTNTTGSTAVGVEALENMNGAGNTAIGKQALRGVGNATGSLNVGIGEMAGDSITSGYRNTMLGQRTDVSTGTGAYQIAIGEDCISYGNSRITVGSGAGNNRWWLGFSTSTGWAHVSDRRYKENIADNTTLGLAFIKDLRPVTFTWKKKSEIDSSLPDYDPTDNADGHKGPPLDTKVQYGLIAQEVKAVIEAHGVPDFGGWEQEETTGIQAVSGEAFIHPLIKAVQEQQVIIDDLKSRIETLEG